MSTVMEIESAISALPQEEFWKLAEWFDAVKERSWDEQIETDAKSGRLDFLFEEAEDARKAATAHAWPAHHEIDGNATLLGTAQRLAARG